MGVKLKTNVPTLAEGDRCENGLAGMVAMCQKSICLPRSKKKTKEEEERMSSSSFWVQLKKKGKKSPLLHSQFLLFHFLCPHSCTLIITLMLELIYFLV